MRLAFDEIDSAIGTIVIAATADGALCALDFDDCRDRMAALLGPRYPGLEMERVPDPVGLSTRLRAYLDGDLDVLDAIAVAPGGTPFQQRVWTALRGVGAGQTISYGALAAAVGRPTASRAVGLCNARNPVALVIPCHRVIGADRSLTGYAGGIERKRWLLAHEGVMLM